MDLRTHPCRVLRLGFGVTRKPPPGTEIFDWRSFVSPAEVAAMSCRLTLYVWHLWLMVLLPNGN